MDMAEIIADGIPWEDSDGATEWPMNEAVSLAESLERRGYTVDVISLDETDPMPWHV